MRENPSGDEREKERERGSRNKRAISAQSRDKMKQRMAIVLAEASRLVLDMGALVFMLITVNVN